MNKQKLKDELKLAKINEAYNRKQMEYYLEEIKILKKSLGEKDVN
jgi:hypothetical protein